MVKLRKPREAEHVASMGKTRNGQISKQKILLEREGRKLRRIILKLVYFAEQSSRRAL
jgi:hypothetical protein